MSVSSEYTKSCPSCSKSVRSKVMLMDSMDVRRHHIPKVSKSKSSSSDRAVSLGMCNDYLIKCMQILTVKKTSVHEKIKEHQKQKIGMERKIKSLQQKLVKVEELLSQEKAIVHSIEQTMKTTEDQYNEIASQSNQLLKEFQENTKNILAHNNEWSYDIHDAHKSKRHNFMRTAHRVDKYARRMAPDAVDNV